MRSKCCHTHRAFYDAGLQTGYIAAQARRDAMRMAALLSIRRNFCINGIVNVKLTSR
jgi:hypothetical protein